MDEKPRRFPWLTLIKIVVGIGLLVLSLWGIEWAQLVDAFSGTKPIWLLAVFASMLMGLLLKIFRWHILMNKYGLTIPFRLASEAYFLGQVVNILLPARGGDVVRLGVVSAHEPAVIPRVTATIALEKFIDLIALALVALGVATYLPPNAAEWLRTGLLPISGLAVFGLTVVIIFGPLLWEQLEHRLAKFTHPWVVRGVSLADKFVQSSLWLRNISNLLPLLIVTVFVWAFMLLNSLILFQALSLGVPVTAAGLVLVLGYIRSSLQLPPGSVGPFYFFAQLGVTTFGAASESALAFAILLHALVTLTPIIASGVLLITSPDARSLLRSTPLAGLVWRTND